MYTAKHMWGVWAAGLVTGILASIAVFNLIHPTSAEQRLKYTAYRECMERTSELHCYMTPQDFLKYYKIREELGL